MPWSQTTEYALRAMVVLAARSGEALTTAEIADATHMPAGYLSKVLQTLGRASLVRSQRGLGGGFTLSRAPEAITVLHVVNAVDPLRRIRECPLGVPGHGSHLCKLHRRMDDALASLEQVFAETRLSDLLRETEGSPLCDTTVLVPWPAARSNRDAKPSATAVRPRPTLRDRPPGRSRPRRRR